MAAVCNVNKQMQSLHKDIQDAIFTLTFKNRESDTILAQLQGHCLKSHMSVDAFRLWRWVEG